MAKRGRPRKVEEIISEEVKEDLTEGVEQTTPQQEAHNTSSPPTPETTTMETDSSIIGDGTFADHNPFADSVVEREYSTPKVASGVVEDIEEPSFMPPSYEDIVAEREGGGEQQEAFTENPFDNPNPALNDLDNKDKKIACESLVDTCLDAYEHLHKYAQYVVKVDEDELMQKQAQGKIDLNEIIPVTENGDTMSVGEFIGQFNEQSQQALSYDKEFGYKVRPAMIRVFMKKGWGMSDEQFLMYMFGKDMAVKVGIMYQLKKSINSTIATLEKAHKRKSQDSKGYSDVYEQETPSSIIDDEPILTSKPKREKEIILEDDEPFTLNEEEYTANLNINMPQNPKDPNAQHPNEIKTQLNKEKKPPKPTKNK